MLRGQNVQVAKWEGVSERSNNQGLKEIQVRCGRGGKKKGEKIKGCHRSAAKKGEKKECVHRKRNCGWQTRCGGKKKKEVEVCELWPLLAPSGPRRTVHSSIWPKDSNSRRTSSSLCCLPSIPTNSFLSSGMYQTKRKGQKEKGGRDQSAVFGAKRRPRCYCCRS